MKLVAELHRWHQSRIGFVVFGLIEFGAALPLLSHAFGTGSLWQYALALLLFVGGLQNMVRFVRTFWSAPISKRGA